MTDMPVKVGVSRGVAGKVGPTTFSFTICTVDSDTGLKDTHGGALFQVSVTDPEGVHTRVKARDLGDGRYRATYTLKKPVLYTVEVRLNGREIDASPFTHYMWNSEKQTGARVSAFGLDPNMLAMALQGMPEIDEGTDEDEEVVAFVYEADDGVQVHILNDQENDDENSK